MAPPPPPATPAPSRFALSQRRGGAQQTQSSQTPGQQTSQPPSQRFHVTPRFATPRPAGGGERPSSSSHATPAALALKGKLAYPRTLSTQDLIDDASSSSSSPEPDAESGGAREGQSSSLPTSPARVIARKNREGRPSEAVNIESSSQYVSDSDGEEGEGGRSPKRRRITISPEIEPSPQQSPELGASSEEPDFDAELWSDPVVAASSQPQQGKARDDLDLEPDLESDPVVASSSQPDADEVGDGGEKEEDGEDTLMLDGPGGQRVLGQSDDDRGNDDGDNEEHEDSEEESDDGLSDRSLSPSGNTAEMRAREPTFLNAPRFKALDNQPIPDLGNPQQNPQVLDALFSPQRRKGARYVNGGLAAELRDWLVEIKRVDGEGDLKKKSRSGTPATTSFGMGTPTATALALSLSVDQVRHGGPGLTLVGGHVQGQDNIRAILAGEGHVPEGFGGHGNSDSNTSSVVRGAVLTMAPPLWNVDLGEGGTWTVAHRWEAAGQGGA
ncbi:hypothetical protein QBC46DRAFT_352512 [Diplogelasinospora grovesii]|uniref:Uncharacterized protein n=1 Tax=Diplogelasinospora grovesii TaxID=303347 RepID=A0AAN6S6Y0_9PEZI|nr:hypothetical protein QBC46DRAFT_352512 [Diplogelasinospora grovesii]